MAEQPTIKTTIQIDRKLWKKMKMEAIMENKTSVCGGKIKGGMQLKWVWDKCRMTFS